MLLLRRFRLVLPLIVLILSSADALPQNSAGSTVSSHELRIPEKARTAFNHGLQRFEKRDFGGSVRFFGKAIDHFPEFYEAYYQLGLAQVHLHQNEDAAGSFQAAIHLSNGHYPLAEFAYALLLCNRGDPTNAEVIVRHGLQQDRVSPDGYVVLGVVLLHLNRLAEAEENAREALARSPKALNAYLVLADVHEQRQEYSAELQDLDAFLALQPNGAHSDNVRLLREAVQQHTRNNHQGKQSD
jgi:tetratricopeptide (TPR) repeat protein